jgi:hypothetical protein
MKTLSVSLIVTVLGQLYRADAFSTKSPSKRNFSPALVSKQKVSSQPPILQRPDQHRPLKDPILKVQLDYARNGHACIRSLLEPNRVRSLHRHLKKYAAREKLLAYQQKVQVALNDPKVHCPSIDECQKLLDIHNIPPLPFLQYFNTWQHLPDVLSLAKSLAPIAAKLLDVPTVRLYQDALFQKETNHGPTPWHVDARMAPFDTSHFVSFWIPLQACTSSALLFCSKSHSDFALAFWNEYERSADSKTSPWNALDARYNYSQVDYMPLAVGDVTIHSGWTLHCADAVTNQEERMALAISFVDARAPIRDVSSRQDDEDAWSYKDWIHKVPKRSYNWDHPSVPVLWPPAKRTKLSSKK